MGLSVQIRPVRFFFKYNFARAWREPSFNQIFILNIQPFYRNNSLFSKIQTEYFLQLIYQFGEIMGILKVWGFLFQILLITYRMLIHIAPYNAWTVVRR
ncbi:hypothetical protein D0T84_12600 [Dysgonomonas sp. 521]|nr:hypothetical protein [Dysgonomonas sp. 521]